MAGSVVEVHPSNAAQLTAWDGEEGEYWAAHAERFDRSIADHHAAFMSAARLGSGERVLDVGCGNGQTSLEAARAVSPAEVVGIDLGSHLLANARTAAAAAQLPNATFVQGDAQVHRFDQPFDVVIGRTSTMFFGDHAAAFRNLRAAMVEDGRLVLLTWQPLERNEWLQEIATSLAGGSAPKLPPPGAGPFSLSDPDRVRPLLTGAGFADVELTGNEAPMWFGADPPDAQRFILGLSGWMLADASDAEREEASAALLRSLARHAGADGVTFRSATWIVTARAAALRP